MPESIEQLAPESIRAAVAAEYGHVVSQPGTPLPFPVGRAFAESLGYPPDLLDSLPARAVSGFAGVSYPLRHAALQPGEEVLDLGCGAGMDSLIAARQVAPRGRVHGLDLSVEMLACAQQNAVTAGIDNMVFHLAPAEEIPLPDRSVDVVTVNGIFNLCPTKEPVMAEVHRVLRPGGRLVVSEIVVHEPAEEGGPSGGQGTADAESPDRTWESWFQ